MSLKAKLLVKRGRGTENKVLVAIAVELETKIKDKKGKKAAGSYSDASSGRCFKRAITWLHQR